MATIEVTIAFATLDKQEEIPLRVAANCTAIIAIKKSGILEKFPEINLLNTEIGIHSKKVSWDASLRDGDRIEIYRPLKVDPKQARKSRAVKPR